MSISVNCAIFIKAFQETVVLIVALLLLLALSFVFALPVEAATCRTDNNRTICLLQIERSAKYPWEYRAVVSVNGDVRPKERYNCRSRVRNSRDGAVSAFEPHGPGDIICSLFPR